MSTSARAMFWIGILCFLPVILPGYENNAIPYGEENRVQLGLPNSPWLMGQWSEKHVAVADGASKTIQLKRGYGFRVEVLSWSALLAIVGTVLIVQSRRKFPQSALSAGQPAGKFGYSR